MSKESVVEAALAAGVARAGGMTFKFLPVVAGCPDRIVLLPGGRIILVELKTASGRLSKIQVLWHTRAARLGVSVTVLSGLSEVKEWTDGLAGS